MYCIKELVLLFSLLSLRAAFIYYVIIWINKKMEKTINKNSDRSYLIKKPTVNQQSTSTCNNSENGHTEYLHFFIAFILSPTVTDN